MRASPILRAWITVNCWALSSVDSPSSLVKSNAYPGFRISSMPARTLRLKLNPLLVTYTRGFIIVVEACESSTTISVNGRLSFQLISCNAYRVG
jgi:hypothetical protein